MGAFTAFLFQTGRAFAEANHYTLFRKKSFLQQLLLLHLHSLLQVHYSAAAGANEMTVRVGISVITDFIAYRGNFHYQALLLKEAQCPVNRWEGNAWHFPAKAFIYIFYSRMVFSGYKLPVDGKALWSYFYP